MNIAELYLNITMWVFLIGGNIRLLMLLLSFVSEKVEAYASKNGRTPTRQINGAMQALVWSLMFALSFYSGHMTLVLIMAWSALIITVVASGVILRNEASITEYLVDKVGFSEDKKYKGVIELILRILMWASIICALSFM